MARKQINCDEQCGDGLEITIGGKVFAAKLIADLMVSESRKMDEIRKRMNDAETPEDRQQASLEFVQLMIPDLDEETYLKMTNRQINFLMDELSEGMRAPQQQTAS